MSRKNLSRILLFVITFFAIIGSVIAYTTTVNKEYRQKAFAALQHDSKERSNSLNNRIDFATNSLTLVADSVSNHLKNNPSDDLNYTLDKLLLKTPFSSIEYIQENGLCELRGKDPVFVNEREYFKRGIMGQSGVWVDYYPLLSQECRITFYTPLKKGNKIVGVLTGIMIPSEDLSEYFNSSFFGKPILGILTDENFNIIMTTDNWASSGTNLNELEDDEVVKDILKHGKNGNENPFYYFSKKSSGSVCVTSLPSCNWHFIQILTMKNISQILDELNKKGLVVSLFIALVLIIYLLHYYLKFSKKTKSVNESHLNIIKAFSLAYENVYLINMDSGKSYVYHDDNFDGTSEYAVGDFMSGVNRYITSEVYEEDRNLFYSIASLNKIENILRDRTSYSFNYRVSRNGELLYYQLEFIRAASDSREFVITIKNIDDFMWKNKSRREIEIIQELFSSGRFSIEFDKNGEIEKCYWSDEFRHLLGYNSSSAFPNTFDAWADIIHPDDKELVLNSLLSVIKDKTNKKNFDITYRLLTKYTGYRWFRTAGIVSRNPDGIPVHFVGMLVNVDDRTRLLKNLSSLSSIYNTMHTVDLVNDEVEVLHQQNHLVEVVNERHNVKKQMIKAIKHSVTDEYLPDMLEFTDLTTISDRLKGKKIIFKDFVGKFSGWCRASFIPIEFDKQHNVIKVMFTTRVIEEDKMREINFMRLSIFDELTGCYNRRAYEIDIHSNENKSFEDNFVFVSIDVNGLKNINDSFGHDAGDELLVGAAKCIMNCMGSYGRVYRTGGDEFQAIIFATEDELEKIQKDLDTTTNNWSGHLVDKVTLSCGYVSHKEYPEMKIRELAKIADERMYSEKSAYYMNKGIDRRGRQSAFDVLGKFLIKILKVNLTTEAFEIIQVAEEKNDTFDFSTDKFTEWLNAFSNSGLIDESDREDYLKNTQLDYLKSIFDDGKELLHLDYKRSSSEKNKSTILEFIRAKNYSIENRWIFLYVKDIEK